MKRFHLVGIIVLALVFGFNCSALAVDQIKIQTPSCDPGNCNFKCAPAAIGPYSQAIQFGDLVFLSGQIALDPCSSPNVITGVNITEQAERVMQNLGAVLKAAGLKFKHVLSSTVYLSNVAADFSIFNAVYGMYFSCNADPCAYDGSGNVIFCCDSEDPYCNKNCGNNELPPPARATVQAGIPKGGLLEVSMVAGK